MYCIVFFIKFINYCTFVDWSISFEEYFTRIFIGLTTADDIFAGKFDRTRRDGRLMWENDLIDAADRPALSTYIKKRTQEHSHNNMLRIVTIRAEALAKYFLRSVSSDRPTRHDVFARDAIVACCVHDDVGTWHVEHAALGLCVFVTRVTKRIKWNSNDIWAQKQWKFNEKHYRSCHSSVIVFTLYRGGIFGVHHVYFIFIPNKVLT